ncbi:MarR family winged helix-turn-helix transcriptional regulator [Thermomonospora umbrina]|uniref:DNA-binding MarR family transcriptional regulator n=1 Tax=Thermomonospora umbrina TaxID=111806 RepID=A0A3D9SWY7_9ACTN|nr:MarR family winged helix-turn-helix transcriptional regulator [Thermomonospora umbrina]REE96131.1 DNA-binding MarR family transcriptional regulator [Thermomonospora umbrina]
MTPAPRPAQARPEPFSAGGPLSYAIFTLARAHRAYAARLLRELGLHLGQEILLMHLYRRDGQTQSELLDAVGLDHSTVSKSLKRMQEAGLLVREPTERDRRVLRVSLTDKGWAMRERIEEMWSELEGISAIGLEPEAVERFVRTAEAIERNIVEHLGEAPPAC